MPYIPKFKVQDFVPVLGILPHLYRNRHVYPDPLSRESIRSWIRNVHREDETRGHNIVLTTAGYFLYQGLTFFGVGIFTF